MRKQMVALLAGAMFMTAITGGVASATTIGYSKTVLGDGQYTFTGLDNLGRAIEDLKVETFDAPLQLSLSGNWDIVNGSLANKYAAPAGSLALRDPSNYLTVPKNLATGTSATATFGLGSNYDYFGLWWGSTDTYNKLEFLKDGVVTETYTGSSVAPPANGNQGAVQTNQYVNFYGLQDYNSFRLTSTAYAFEVDNIAVGNVVPEPGTMLLLGMGMLGLAIYGKRRMNKEA